MLSVVIKRNVNAALGVLLTLKKMDPFWGTGIIFNFCIVIFSFDTHPSVKYTENYFSTASISLSCRRIWFWNYMVCFGVVCFLLLNSETELLSFCYLCLLRWPYPVDGMIKIQELTYFWCVCVWACMCVCVCTCMRTCMHTWVQVNFILVIQLFTTRFPYELYMLKTKKGVCLFRYRTTDKT